MVELDLLHGRNEAQRWQAIVSQFNAALAIQQDLQRSIYEEKFDIIRRENDNMQNALKKQRLQLESDLCEALDQLDISKDKEEEVSNQHLQLQKQLSEMIAERQQLQRMDNLLMKKGKSWAEGERRAEEELAELEKEKKELKEEIKDLRGFIKITNNLDPEAVGQSFTVRK